MSKEITRRKKAQAVLEYALVIVVVVGVLIAMGNYASRSMQGRIKDSVDNIGGEQFPGSFQTIGTGFGQAAAHSHVQRSATSISVSHEGHQLSTYFSNRRESGFAGN